MFLFRGPQRNIAQASHPPPDVLSLSHNLAHLLAFVIKFLPLQAHQFAELRHFQVFILLGNARSNVVAKKNVRCEHKFGGGGQKVMLRQQIWRTKYGVGCVCV